MLRKTNFLLYCVISLSFIGLLSFVNSRKLVDDKIISYIVDTKTQNIRFYWRDDHLKPFGSILNLKNWLINQNKTLVFAMNGGIYMTVNRPLGLFIQDYKTITRLNTRSNGYGNFYTQPNGVFYVTGDKHVIICTTKNFSDDGNVKFATQSGPMLVIDNEINPEFRVGSTNLNIRNGVGILSNNKVIFAMSKEEINFYDFAKFFKDMGCRNALYLDGAISQMYLPEKNWIQTDGDFGVIIAEVRN